MKKIYFAPETEIVTVAVQPLLSASDPESGFNQDTVTETEETTGNLSRRGSLWDEEE